MKPSMNRILALLLFLTVARFFTTDQVIADTHHIVFVIAEDEYKASESLTTFASKHLTPSDGFRTTFLFQDPANKYRIPGFEKLASADLVVLYVRRRSLPEQDMNRLREYLNRGKPLLALRTSSHAWDTRDKGPKDNVEWPTFDPEVLGGNYHGHHGNTIESTIEIIPGMSKHPILRSVNVPAMIGKGSLYKVSPLESSAQVLLVGKIPSQPTEPILWTNRYGKSKVVYTSLGHVGDFAQSGFNQLIKNTVSYLIAD